MTNKLKFIWIDDQNREEDANNLAKQMKVKCEFVYVQPRDTDYLSLIDRIKPDLILIDHNLTEIGNGKIKKGSTVAALIREKHPNYAIACITGQSDDIDSQQKLSYESIFSLDNIENHYQTMISIAKSFKKLNSSKPTTTDEIIGLLTVPQDDKIKLSSILPQELKKNFNDKTLISNISHWVRNILVERPGFLFDRIWMATLLGLNEAGFRKVEGLFQAAKYKGVFADSSKERWWKSKALDILSKKSKEPAMPWERGRKLPAVTTSNFSKDYYTNYKEDLPEVVAYIDESSNQKFPMKLKYTIPHPRFEKLLYFEDIRMMKTD